MNPPQLYTATAKWLHWIIVALIGVELLTAGIFDGMQRGASKLAIVNIHMSFGVIIVALMLVRIAWRLRHHAPPLPKETPRWQVLSAYAMHYVLYTLLFLIPLSGWIWANAIGWHVTVFGFVALPDLVGKGSSLLRLSGEAHALLVGGLVALVSVHVLASLYHWYVKLDDVLERMLPADRYTTRALRYFERFR